MFICMRRKFWCIFLLGGGQQIFGWISFAESNSSSTNETGAGGCGGCTAARRKLPRRVPKRNFGCLKRWKASPSCTPMKFRRWYMGAFRGFRRFQQWKTSPFCPPTKFWCTRRFRQRNFGCFRCLKLRKASPSCTPTQFRLFETMDSFSVVYPQRNFGCFRLSALGNTTKSFLPSHTNAICGKHPL